MSQQVRYSMLIEWSNLDNAYIVSFPEWERAGHLANTHGATYVEAAQKGQEMLEFLLDASAKGEAVPAPALFDDHAYALGETAEDISRETRRILDEVEAAHDVSRDAPESQTRT
jgi:antitoxin HicB